MIHFQKKNQKPVPTNFLCRLCCGWLVAQHHSVVCPPFQWDGGENKKNNEVELVG